MQCRVAVFKVWGECGLLCLPDEMGSRLGNPVRQNRATSHQPRGPGTRSAKFWCSFWLQSSTLTLSGLFRAEPVCSWVILQDLWHL